MFTRRPRGAEGPFSSTDLSIFHVNLGPRSRTSRSCNGRLDGEKVRVLLRSAGAAASAIRSSVGGHNGHERSRSRRPAPPTSVYRRKIVFTSNARLESRASRRPKDIVGLRCAHRRPSASLNSSDAKRRDRAVRRGPKRSSMPPLRAERRLPFSPARAVFSTLRAKTGGR